MAKGPVCRDCKRVLKGGAINVLLRNESISVNKQLTLNRQPFKLAQECGYVLKFPGLCCSSSCMQSSVKLAVSWCLRMMCSTRQQSNTWACWRLRVDFHCRIIFTCNVRRIILFMKIKMSKSTFLLQHNAERIITWQWTCQNKSQEFRHPCLQMWVLKLINDKWKFSVLALRPVWNFIIQGSLEN